MESQRVKSRINEERSAESRRERHVRMARMPERRVSNEGERRHDTGNSINEDAQMPIEQDSRTTANDTGDNPAVDSHSLPPLHQLPRSGGQPRQLTWAWPSRGIYGMQRARVQVGVNVRWECGPHPIHESAQDRKPLMVDWWSMRKDAAADQTP